jgi:hypothetical protein
MKEILKLSVPNHISQYDLIRINCLYNSKYSLFNFSLEVASTTRPPMQPIFTYSLNVYRTNSAFQLHIFIMQLVNYLNRKVVRHKDRNEVFDRACVLFKKELIKNAGV